MFGGIEYAVSLDFDYRVLTEILNGCPPSVGIYVACHVPEDNPSPTTDYNRGRNGLPKSAKSLNEQFVPLVIMRRVLS